DLAVEDLQERLKAGKIYAPEKIQQALSSFFQQENLSTLRELALREVAETLDRASGARRAGEQSNPGPALGRVMVCLSSYPPRAAILLRRGSRIAGRLNTDWFVVYVETPRSAAPHRCRGAAPPFSQHGQSAGAGGGSGSAARERAGAGVD